MKNYFAGSIRGGSNIHSIEYNRVEELKDIIDQFLTSSI